MSYSIKNYLKSKQDALVTVDDIKQIATEINALHGCSIDSTLTIIARYVTVAGNKLKIDINKRDPLRKYDDLLKMCNKDTVSDEISTVSRPPEQPENSKVGLLNIDNKTIEKTYDETDPVIKVKLVKKKIEKKKEPEIKINYVFPADPPLVKSTIVSFLGPVGVDSMYDAEIKDDPLTETELNLSRVVEALMSVEYPVQRSAKWFELRDTMITASDGGTVLGLDPYKTPCDFLLKKVFGQSFKTELPCYHGKKYETIATMIYETRMNVKVAEFGLCQHPVYKFLGASPDGIVGKFKMNGINFTKYVGKMLEIKCPFRRKILMKPTAPAVYGIYGEKITNIKYDCKKGVCPTYYWVQVQLQLQCCGLDECDFLQCEIVEYDSYDDFVQDSKPDQPWISRTTNYEKGAVIQIIQPDKLLNDADYDQNIWDNAEFIYPPRLDMTPHEVNQWLLRTIEQLNVTHKGKVFDRIFYWKLVQVRNLPIKRDDSWFNKNLHIFKKAWDNVEFLRANKNIAEGFQRFIVDNPNETRESLATIINTLSDNTDDTKCKLFKEMLKID